MGRLNRAIFFSAIERYGSVALFIVSAAVLSRLLSPKEFGLYAVVNAFVSIVGASFQEIGGANYLIQKRSLSEGDIRTSFTITFGLSVVVGIAIISLRDVFAWVFAQELLKYGVTVAALSFVLTPISSTLSALFRRDMNFRTLAFCGLGGSAATAGSSIALAALGYSYMAPIWGMLVGNAVTTVLLIGARRNFIIYRPSLAGYSDVLSFGLYSSAISVINVFCTLAPQMFVARILDFRAVGLYNRAINTTQMFDKLIIQILNPVIMPAIVAQAEAGRSLKTLYLDALRMLSVVQWPFLIFIAVMAPPIIVTWLGAGWSDVVPLIRVLCVANLAMFGACMTYPVLVAAGRVRDALISSLIALPPSMIVGLIAAFYGVQALAASALITLPFQAAISIYYVNKHLGIGARELAHALRKSAIVTGCAAVGVLASEGLVELHFLGPISGLVLATVLAAVGWLLGLIATAHPLLGRLQVAAQSLPFNLPKVLFQVS